RAVGYPKHRKAQPRCPKTIAESRLPSEPSRCLVQEPDLRFSGCHTSGTGRPSTSTVLSKTPPSVALSSVAHRRNYLASDRPSSRERHRRKASVLRQLQNI